MAQRIAGPGLGLPLPQGYFPHLLASAAQDPSSMLITLSPGDVFVIPAGDFNIQEGSCSFVQWLDPVTGSWRTINPAPDGMKRVFSDGYNYRLANLGGCPVSATVAGGGTSFTQATATITANVGGSTWQPVVGGSLSVVSITNAGASYTMPPMVVIPNPPPGLGVQASGHAVLTNGTVSAITLDNVGAGYLVAPTALTLYPNPTDPNAGLITNATISMGLTNAGLITAAICTNSGASLATLTQLTLTAAGGSGSGATITPNVLQVVTGVTIGTAGTGYSANNEVVSVGGNNVSVAAVANPAFDLTNFRPRSVSLKMAVTGGSFVSVAAIYDNGLFTSIPTPLVINNTGVAPTAAATITFAMGGIVDTVMIQPV